MKHSSNRTVKAIAKFYACLITFLFLLCMGQASANPSNENLYCIGQNRNLFCFDKKSKVFDLIFQAAPNTVAPSQERREKLMLYADNLTQKDDQRNFEEGFYDKYIPVEDEKLSATWTNHVHDTLLRYLNPNETVNDSIAVIAPYSPPRRASPKAMNYWFSLLKADLFSVVIDDSRVSVSIGKGFVDALYEPGTKTISSVTRQILQEIAGFQTNDQELVETAKRKLSVLLSDWLSMWLRQSMASLNEAKNRDVIARFLGVHGPRYVIQENETEASFLREYLANKSRHVYVMHGKYSGPFTTRLLGNLYIAKQDVDKLERAGLMAELFKHESTHVKLNAVSLAAQFSSLIESMLSLADHTNALQTVNAQLLKPFRLNYNSAEEILVDVPILVSTDGDNYLSMLRLLLPEVSPRLLIGVSLRQYLSESSKLFKEEELRRINALWESVGELREENSSGRANKVIYAADALADLVSTLRKAQGRDAAITQKLLLLFDGDSFMRDYANFVKAREILNRSGFYKQLDDYLQNNPLTGEK